jgi:protein-disulfide isomerase
MSFFNSWPVRAAAVVVGVACTFAAGMLVRGSMMPPERGQVEAIIKDYLLNNPAVVRMALEEMERASKAEEESKKQQAVADLSPQIFSSKFQTVLGNPDGKIQLVEFFDYNCGYCKHAVEDLATIMKSNSDVRIVLKEFPVLGPGSVEAAQVALALHKQFDGQKYWDFHQKLLASRGQTGRAQALSMAQETGADMDKLQADMKSDDVRSGLAEVMKIADTLGMNGTPSYVVGDEVVVGAVGAEQLQGKIDNLRKCGKTACI